MIVPAFRTFVPFPGIMASAGGAAAGGALATITVVGATSAESGGGTTGLSLTLPSGIAANDLILLMLSAHWLGTATVSTGPPAGYSEIGSAVFSNDASVPPRNSRMWVWQKRAAGDEGGTSVPLNTSAASEGALAIVLRDTDPSGTIESTGSLFGSDVDDPRPTAPTLSAGAGLEKRLAVLFWAQAEDTGTLPAPAGWTGGAGTDYTLRASFTQGTGEDRMGSVLTAAMATGETISGKRPVAGTYVQGWVTRGFVIKPLASASGPKIYYVDASATGNDSANGLSPSTPWKTITKVNGSTFQPGDTILFAGGQTFTGGLALTATSWNRTAAATNPVTIGSYGTGRATINSGSTYGLISENLGGFHLRDLVFQGNNTASIHGVMIWNSETGNGKIQYVRVTNLLIQGYGNSGFILYGANAPGSSAGFNDVIIDSVVATDNTKAGGVTGTSGIRVAGSLGYMANPAFPTHTNVTIRNCTTHGNPGIEDALNWTGSGIVVGEVEDGLIEYCTAYNNGANSNSTDGPVGIFAYSSNRVTIQYCESYNNSAGNAVDGGGFDLDVGMTNSVIQYCYSHGNAGPGFMMYNQTGAITPIWDNNTIRYCISQNDAVGRSAWGSGGITISKSNATMTNPLVYNNTIYTNSAVAATCYIGMDGTGTISGGKVANNIFYASAGAWLVNTEIYNPTGVTFQNNDYHATVAANFRVKWNNSTYSGTGGLTSWGRDTGGLTTNPQLVNAGNGGTLNGYAVGQPAAYKLQIGSPMIGTGLNINATFPTINPGTKDFYGSTIPVSTTFEIGAYEGTGATGVYYVDASATGNDSANGLTTATPWKTIAKVNGSTFQPGDSILFAGGQTFTGTLSFTSSSWPSATPSSPVTIGSYGTGRATISSGTGRGFIAANIAAFHLRDLNFVGTASPVGIDGVYIANDLTGTAKLNYIRCTNLDISGYGRNGLSLYGGETSDTRVGFNDVILDGVVAHGNCTRDEVSSAGIRVKGEYGYNVNGTPSHTNVTLRNCVAYDNLGWAGPSSGWTGTGIVLAQVQTALVEFCVSYNNGANNTNASGPVGMFTYDSDQVTIQYCESYNNQSGSNTDGGGFDLDGGVTNSIIQYCYAHGNAGAGFMLFAYADTGVTTWSNNTVRYCISQNDAVGRTGWGAGGLIITKFNATMTNARAYNNTIYSNSTTAAVCYVGPQGTGTMSGTVANNIFYSSNNARLVDAELYNPTGVTFQKNDYYGPGGVRFRWNGVSTTSRTAWGRDATGLDVNPQLFSAGNGGTIGGYVVGLPSAYRLVAGSPMIGAGLNMSTTFSINPGTKDFFSTTIPVGGTFEIGAYEGPGV